MEIVATDEAQRLIADRGGRLYVSIKTTVCCGGRTMRMLSARTNVRRDDEYRSLGDAAGFELFVPRELTRLPETLEVCKHRLPTRIGAYWNGSCWID